MNVYEGMSVPEWQLGLHTLLRRRRVWKINM